MGAVRENFIDRSFSGIMDSKFGNNIDGTPQLTRGKRFAFSLVLVAVSVTAALYMGEYFLRYRNQRIAQSNHFDPGHIVYDSLLGWKLAANWKGSHRHHDFDVSYSTNRYRFRGKFPEYKPEGVKRYALVGDSFTFSYGVNDNETFIHLLNQIAAGKRQFLNFGVPGYSTDQELLLVKESVLLFKPDVIVLVVYLGNDLYDNLLPFPLQADRAKPFFKLTGDSISLENVPVPITKKSVKERKQSLRTVGLEGAGQQSEWSRSVLGRFQVVRFIAEYFTNSSQNSDEDFKIRFQEALNLFYMIVDKIESVCRNNGIQMQIVLMPGQSFVTAPRTLSARIQDFFKREILSNSERWDAQVLDLTGFLRREYTDVGERLFYAHEGHLNRQGHRMVAEFLVGKL